MNCDESWHELKFTSSDRFDALRFSKSCDFRCDRFDVTVFSVLDSVKRMNDQKIRLQKLLERHQGGLSKRKFADKLGISFTSLLQYLSDNDQFPETDNLERIAKGLRMSRGELKAYLEDRPFEPSYEIEELFSEIRAVKSLEQAEEVLQVAANHLIALAKAASSRKPPQDA